jgi:integrase/recombinase XerC
MRDLRQWAEFATGGHVEQLDAQSVTTSDIRLWVAKLSRDGDSPRTLRRKLSALRAFYAYLIKRHGFTSNPAADIHSPKADKPLPVYVRQNEMAALLADDFDAGDFTEVRNRLILLMFYSTGMRTTELETLLDTNVNTQRGELKVLGKRNKERIIPFGDELSEMITLYRQLRDTTVGGAPTNEFFVRPDGQPLYRQLIYRVVHSALQGRTVAPRQSPHVLRHTFAGDMLNNGADLFSVQQLLGHKSLETTQVYTHITYQELKNNYQLAHPRAAKKGGTHGS